MKAHSLRQKTQRPGTALVLVLVVIAMLTLGAYTFSEMMLTEYRAATAYDRQSQSRAWTASGVEYVAALLAPNGGGRDADLYHNPGLFHVPVSAEGGFTIASPVEDLVVSPQSRRQGEMILRMGLQDESGKINVNALALLDPSDGVAHQMLLALPGMTDEIADAILDWIDSDDTPRDFGMEVDDYQTLIPRNGPLTSLEELLLIEGVTPWLLYGEDSNRNGLLDPNENDGSASMPSDNEDDILDLGWSACLTVCSKESNLRHAGDAYGEVRVNVNQELLTDLYDELEEKFDADIARFVTAYRLNGPLSASSGSAGEDSSSSGSGSSGSGSSGSNSSGSGSSSGSSSPFGAGGSSGGSSSAGSGGESGGGGQSSGRQSRGQTVQITGLWRPNLSASGSAATATTGDAETDAALLDAANSLANALSGGEGTITRGGLDLSQGASTQIQSIYQLIGSQVAVTIDEQESVLESPWSADPGNLQEILPDLLDRLTITTEESITGRININEAPVSVLTMIPGMPEDLPEQIVATRSQRLSQNGVSSDRFATAGWLLIEGLVDLPTMVELDSSITARGDVFRFQVIGHSDRGGMMNRMEATIDASTAVPKILRQRSLSPLGSGYQNSDLPTFGTGEDRASR